MARDHYIVPTAPSEESTTVRLGAGNAVGDRFADVDAGKLVKLVGESRYNLCALGDEIEGVVSSVESATQNGYSIGGIVTDDCRIYARADGLQATPGVGVLAVGDYVVAGTVTAKGTALTDFPKVVKATSQTGIFRFAWRVVSLGTVGTGAVGTTVVIECI
jgi:hypothetical protein